jgi:uncharacterized protein (DUF433 family)
VTTSRNDSFLEVLLKAGEIQIMATMLKSVRKKNSPPKTPRVKSPSPNGRLVDFTGWAQIVGATPKEVEAAWNELKQRGLVAVRQGKLDVSADAMCCATSDVQRCLASHLSGYELTENSYIVRRAGPPPPGSPMILNTRIYVQYIANYFRGGWGVAEIQRDLPQLTPEQIEAAIQYYLNHREEIEREIQESIDIFEANLQRQERTGLWPELTRR